MDPNTLDTIASMALPPRLPGSPNIFNDFAGGGYFYLDNRDRAVVPTTTRHVFVVAVGAAGFTQERDYDLTGAVGVGDKIISALPVWSGLLWFASTKGWWARWHRPGRFVRSRSARASRIPSLLTIKGVCTWSPRRRSTASTRLPAAPP